MLAYWLSSTDHKIIGYLYLITSFGFFLFAGILAMIMRAQLIGPNNSIVSDQQYNELFTMHGTIMLLLFATPLFGERVTVDDPWGFGNSLEWATSCPPPRHNFHPHPADQVRAAGVRPALPAHQAGPGLAGDQAVPLRSPVVNSRGTPLATAASSAT